MTRLNKLKLPWAAGVAASLLVAAGSASAQPDPDLIGHWALDEGTGTATADAVGTATGALTDGMTWLSPGRLGNAVVLDGTLGSVDLGQPDYTSDFTSTLTISLWVRPDAFTVPDARLASRATGVNEQDHYWMVSTIEQTGLRFRLKAGGQTTTLASETGLLAAGQWHHVAAVYDGLEMRIYRNGQLVASGPKFGAIDANAAVPVALGNQPAGAGDRPLTGALDDVRLYRRALSPTEIGNLAFPDGNQPPTAVAAASPLVGEPPLTVVFDASGSYDVDGTISSTKWRFSASDSATAPVVSRTFPALGQYTALLEVKDNEGDVGVDSVMITVTEDVVLTIPFTHDVIDADPPGYTHCKGAGDIDGDGLLDVFVAGARDGDGFFWYRNPTWERHTIVPAGVTGFSTDMAVADMDGDGDLDAIIPEGFDYGDATFWYENPRPGGDPAVDPWVAHPIGTAGAHDVEVGDVDGDGDLDVVVRWLDTTLYLQTAPDSWTAVTLDTQPYEGLDLADLDGDGDLDVVLDGRWRQNPAPGGNPATDPWPERTIVSGWTNQARVRVADIDADGFPDVVLAASEVTGQRVAWFGTSDPVTGPWVEHTVTPRLDYVHSLEVADLDLDGDLDIVTAEMHQSSDPDKVSVFRNGGGGLTWTEQVIATTGSHNMVVADLDADGDIDLMGANHAQPPLETWRNELNPQSGLGLDAWDRHVLDPAMPWQPVFLEPRLIDDDPYPDLVAGGWWFRNPGAADGAWERNDVGLPLRNMAVVHDFDGDGDDDILGTQSEGYDPGADFSWARNDGTGGFTVLSNIAPAAGEFLQGTAVASLAGDGLLDVVLSWQNGVDTQVLNVPAEPATGTWSWEVIAGTTQGEGLAIGDIDRDGDLDILQGTQWLRNDGGAWTKFDLFPPSTDEPDRVFLVDIDGDGRLDSLVGYGHDRPAGSLSWYAQPAVATDLWTEHVIGNPYNPQSVDLADLDLDGDLDLVVGEHNLPNLAASRLLIYENVDGGGLGWRERVLHTGDEHHVGARLLDVEGDGDLDIASIGYTHPRLMLYENRARTSVPSAVPDDGSAVPAARLVLATPTPNPFNPATRIRYELPRAGRVDLAVYDVRGRRVAQLVDEEQVAGSHEVVFAPRGLASGVYLAHLQAGGEVHTTRMLLLK